MFSFSKLTSQPNHASFASINLGISKLNNLIEIAALDVKRKGFYEYVSRTPLRDRLLSLGYAMGVPSNIPIHTTAMAGLQTTANKYSACTRVLALPINQIYALANQTTLILEDVIGALKSNELNDIKLALEAFQKELVAAIKIYLQDSNNNHDYKGLLYSFSRDVCRHLKPLHDFKVKQRKSGQKQPEIIAPKDKIDWHFIRSDFSERDIPVDYSATDKDLRTKLENYVKYYENGYRSFSEIISNAAQVIARLPGEVKNIYDAWNMQRQINADPVKKAKYKLHNHLGAHDSKRHHVLVEDDDNDSDADFDDKVKVCVRKPMQINNFTEYYAAIEAFKNDVNPGKVDALRTENVEILKALCNRIQDAKDGRFYPANELKVVSRANTLRQKYHQQDAVTIDEVKEMKVGLGVKFKHEKYCAAANEFNQEGVNNIFQILKGKINTSNDDDNEVIALSQIEAAWKKRREFANLPSSSLSELQGILDKLESYAEILEADSEAISTEQKQVAAELAGTLKQLIIEERKILVHAMLERLALVPGNKLIALNPNDDQKNSQPFYDDVIFATMESLVPYGLSSDYIKRFRRQAPPYQTLTVSLICQFNDFIGKYGSDEQKQMHLGLYSNTHNGHQRILLDNIDQSTNTESILIPTRIAGHLQARIKTSDNALGESAILIDKPTAEPKPAISELSAATTMQQSGMGMSFNVLETNKQIYIPLGLKLDEVEYSDKLILDFYDLIKDDHLSKTGDITDFTLNQRAKKYFHDVNNQLLFVKTADNIMENNGVNLSVACRQSLSEIAIMLIKAEADETFKYQNMPDKFKREYTERFIKIAEKLANNYIQSDAIEDSFEYCVTERALKHIFTIEQHARKIQNELNDLGVNPKHAEDTYEYFTHSACYYFEHNKNNDLGLAIAEAELDTMLFSHSKSIPKDFQIQFRDFAKAALSSINLSQFTQSQDAILNIIDDVKNLIRLKIDLKMFLKSEIMRIKNHRYNLFMDKTKTAAKIKLLSDQLTSVDNITCYEDVRKIEDALTDKNGAYTQSRVKNIFRLFGSSDCDSLENLDDFIVSHPLRNNPVVNVSARPLIG